MLTMKKLFDHTDYRYFFRLQQHKQIQLRYMTTTTDNDNLVTKAIKMLLMKSAQVRSRAHIIIKWQPDWSS